VPNDVDIARAIDNYRPVVLDSPNSTGAKAFMNLNQGVFAKAQYLGGDEGANF
jgi:MinD-like ATPase involved in chromosome partitioning or flagellar assembly